MATDYYRRYGYRSYYGYGPTKAGILNHPTDVAVDPDGDIYVADWGNHRLCIFDAEEDRGNRGDGCERA